MNEQTSSSNVAAEQPANLPANNLAPSAETTAVEHRQVYGTAKTENLRDSGLWRILLPALVIVCCIALVAVPLLILIPLLSNSINALSSGNASEGQLLWVWITMIVLDVAIAGFIIWGFYKVFLTQAGNYQR